MYTKLFAKILDSSIWLEPTSTRIVWITLLAAMDEDGYAHFSATENLAARARVTVGEAESAIDCFMAPDKNSGNPDHEGRRVERVPGGFLVLNAQSHRESINRIVEREKTRLRVAKHREAKRNDVTSLPNVTKLQNDTLASVYASSSSLGECENLFFGDVPADLVSMAGRLSWRETAGEWQDYVESEIKKIGYSVSREVPCALPDGDGGRIDLVASMGTITIAIELDRRTPRKKSVAKVQTYPAGMVLLRDPKITRNENPPDSTPVQSPGSPAIPPVPQWLSALLKKWVVYCQEKHMTVTASQEVELSARLLAMGEARSASAISSSIANGYKGVFEPPQAVASPARTNGLGKTDHEVDEALRRYKVAPVGGPGEIVVKFGGGVAFSFDALDAREKALMREWQRSR